MRLDELSNTSYTFHKLVDPKMGDNTYEFRSSNGLTYFVIFNLYSNSHLEIEFELSENPLGKRSKVSVSGTGDQFKIFSTIKNIVDHHLRFMNLNILKYISFLANGQEPSRVKLYDKFIPIIQKMLGDHWQFMPHYIGVDKEYSFKNLNVRQSDNIK